MNQSLYSVARAPRNASHMAKCVLLAFISSAVVNVAANAQNPTTAEGKSKTVTQDGAAPDRGQAYTIMDRVEINVGGTWYPGVILGVQDGKYQVKRDDYSSDFVWYSPSVIRALAYAKPAKPLPREPLPAAVPRGTYQCWTLVSGFYGSSPQGAAMGHFRITGATTYTGLSRESAGTAGQFVYDARTGKMNWSGAKLQGFFGTVTETNFSLDNKGVPVITITYRVREGGNFSDLSCRRSTD